jgi:hypothetical protein
MSSELIFRQKITLNHKDRKRRAIFEMVVYGIPKSKDYPKGIKYRAWFSEHGETLFGFDNHKPKGPHLHIRKIEIGYNYRGVDALMDDIKAMIEKEGFVYENE